MNFKTDFNVEVSHEGEIKILQITDMQVIDSSQERRPDRLVKAEYEAWLPENKDYLIYDHIRYLVKETNPDLILITGDIIYGEFDDNGSAFTEFTAFMDSFDIPWAPVFGNHDNESEMGIEWQCKQFEDAKNCLFKRGSVFGNGNYTIGISQNGVLKRGIFMMDSNGCGLLRIPGGFKEDQLEWMKSEAEKIHTDNPGLPLFLCCHIPTADFLDAYFAKGYMDKSNPDKDWRENFNKFEIGTDVPAHPGDFGRKYEGIPNAPAAILPLLKECNFDGYFVGHWHRTNTSVLYEGIRFTFGFKTGYYDYRDDESIGGTLITLNNDDKFEVEHIHYVEQ